MGDIDGEAPDFKDPDDIKNKWGMCVTPDKIRDFYGMSQIKDEDQEKAKERELTAQAVYSSLGEYWSPQDRETFQERFKLPVKSVLELDNAFNNSANRPMASHQKCVDNHENCCEANLDVQYMIAMSPHSKMGYYYQDESRSFEDFVTELSEMENPPHVVSISYSMPEAEISSSSAKSFDDVMKKLATQGITVLSS